MSQPWWIWDQILWKNYWRFDSKYILIILDRIDFWKINTQELMLADWQPQNLEVVACKYLYWKNHRRILFGYQTK